MKEKMTKYDLQERTAKFGEAVILTCRKVSQDIISRPIISQLVRSSTSVGANYREANGASSRKDFRNKIYICKKEAQETEHWLRMLRTCVSEMEAKIDPLFNEAHELSLIFHAIGSTIDSNEN